MFKLTSWVNSNMVEFPLDTIFALFDSLSEVYHCVAPFSEDGLTTSDLLERLFSLGVLWDFLWLRDGVVVKFLVGDWILELLDDRLKNMD